MSVLDNLATWDESCGGALDASGVVDHGRHGSRGDWWRVINNGGRVVMLSLALL